MLTSHFEELHATRYKLIPQQQQQHESSHVVHVLQHASWLAQAELQTYSTSSSDLVPIYASPQFTLCTYASSTTGSKSSNEKVQQVAGYAIQALKYDKYAGVAENQSNDTEVLRKVSKFQNYVGINGMSLNEKVNQAISTSVSRNNNENENDDVSHSPSTNGFSPSSYTFDRDLNCDQLSQLKLEINYNTTNDMVSSGYTDQSATINCLDEYFSSQPKYKSPSYTFSKPMDSNALHLLQQQLNEL
jgi:hypothetical protein